VVPETSEASVKIDASAVEQLIVALKDRDVCLRTSAAWVLGRLGDKRAVEPLVAALGDARVTGDGWGGRVQPALAAVALGRLGDKRAVKPLIDALKHYPPSLKIPGRIDLVAFARLARRGAAKILDALVDVGPPAVEPLIGVLKDENALVRSFAAEGLGELGDKRAVQPLVAVLKDEDEEVRRSATEALRKLGWQPGTDVE
jgi:HEAT repeat protein